MIVTFGKKIGIQFKIKSCKMYGGFSNGNWTPYLQIQIGAHFSQIIDFPNFFLDFQEIFEKNLI